MRLDLVLEVVVVERHLTPRCLRVHDAGDRADELRPARFFAQQLFLALRREAVELGALVGLTDAPLGLQPAALHQAMQGGIEGAGFDFQEIVGLCPDRLADAVAVLRPPLQRAQDEHVERALQQFQASFIRSLGMVVDSLRP